MEVVGRPPPAPPSASQPPVVKAARASARSAVPSVSVGHRRTLQVALSKGDDVGIMAGQPTLTLIGRHVKKKAQVMLT